MTRAVDRCPISAPVALLLRPSGRLSPSFYLEWDCKVRRVVVSKGVEILDVRAEIRDQELHHPELGELSDMHEFVREQRG